LELYRADPQIGERQRQKLAEVRSRRDEARVKKTLAQVGEAARGTVNMMSSISDAVKAYASIGEICAVLREHFGTYHEPVAL
jgi:methylmalonyl-CoA mutase N-terminal domain/subunit